MRSGIYCISSTASETVYIGSSVDVDKRIATHTSHLAQNRHENEHLQRAYDKYGVKCFKIELIERVFDTSELLRREQMWIDHLRANKKALYNMRLVAGSNLGMKFRPRTDAMKRNYSLSKMGEKNPCFGRSPSNKGKKRPEISGPLHPRYGRCTLVDKNGHYRTSATMNADGSCKRCYAMYAKRKKPMVAL